MNLHKYDFDFSSWPVDFSWTINEEYAINYFTVFRMCLVNYDGFVFQKNL